MKILKVYIGNIRKCTKFENSLISNSITYPYNNIQTDSEIYKENAVLMEFQVGEYEYSYIDLDEFILNQNEIKEGNCDLGSLMMPTSAYCKCCLFVDESSLKSKYTEQDNEQEKEEINQLEIKLRKVLSLQYKKKIKG